MRRPWRKKARENNSYMGCFSVWPQSQADLMILTAQVLLLSSSSNFMSTFFSLPQSVLIFHGFCLHSALIRLLILAENLVSRDGLLLLSSLPATPGQFISCSAAHSADDTLLFTVHPHYSLEPPPLPTPRYSAPVSQDTSLL